MVAPHYDKQAFNDYLDRKIADYGEAMKDDRSRVSGYVRQMLMGCSMIHTVCGPQNALDAAYKSHIKAGLLTKFAEEAEIEGITQAMDSIVAEMNGQFGLGLENPMRSQAPKRGL